MDEEPRSADELAGELCAVDFWTPEHVRQVLHEWENELRAHERRLAAAKIRTGMDWAAHA